MNNVFLVTAAVIPVFVICFLVYYRDPNKEPITLLLKIFFLGFVSVFPAYIIEVGLDYLFPTAFGSTSSYFELFINVFVGVALVEEAVKWAVVKFFGYNSKEFDEIYDIIVYSVFSSLGFACLENIFYVVSSGFKTAINRAIFSIPGHMCFGVLMGYFFSKAKISSLNNTTMSKKNLLLSLLVPCLFHTIYDSLLFNGTMGSVLLFLFFDLFMVIICICVIISVSKVQNNVKLNINNGTIVSNNGNVEVKPVEVVQTKYNYCPICGRAAGAGNFCGGCGMKLTK